MFRITFITRFWFVKKKSVHVLVQLVSNNLWIWNLLRIFWLVVIIMVIPTWHKSKSLPEMWNTDKRSHLYSESHSAVHFWNAVGSNFCLQQHIQVKYVMSFTHRIMWPYINFQNHTTRSWFKIQWFIFSLASAGRKLFQDIIYGWYSINSKLTLTLIFTD